MIERLDVRDVSLDDSVAPNSALRLLDLLPAADNQECDLFELQLRKSQQAVVRRALSELDKRERYIVERRMMVDASEALSLADIGRNFGVSRERARQLEVRAVRKLRKTVIAFGDPVVEEWLSLLRGASRRGDTSYLHQRAKARIPA